MIKLLGALLLLGNSALALSPLPADFEPGEEALGQIGRANFVRASLHLKILSESAEDECSGAFVSDGGHLLTASHCLDSCRFHEDGSPKGAKRCMVQIDDAVMSFDVLKANACPLRLRQRTELKRAAGLDPEESPEACRDGDFSDHALLRPAVPAALGNFGCLPIASARAPLGEAVFTMGYPAPTVRAEKQRASARDSTGRELLFSSGKVVKQDFCEGSWSVRGPFGRMGKREFARSETIQAAILKLYGGMLQTTVDIYRGSSGGPLVNPAGEVVGVASVIDPEVHNEKRECRGATFFQPVTLSTFGREAPRCERRRSLPGPRT